ncbi:MAG: class I cytochrome c, partial [Betaproteobacteria bacterium]|nr:class I cytochrome c [Betaproteobacteria bacterium]
WSNNCAKCHHSTDKKDKEGSPYKEIAKKYRGDANAEAKLFEHLTTGPRVKAPDGSEDDHRIVRGNKAKIENLVKWILAH